MRGWMMTRIGGRHGVVLTVFFIFATGCLSLQSESVVLVRSKASADQRKQVAQAYVTDENLVRLRTRVKERLPAATDEQLQGLYLRSNIKPGDDETAAAVIVGIRGQGLDGGELMRIAGEIVDSDIKESCINNAILLPAKGGVCGFRDRLWIWSCGGDVR
jgi:hypothetical protein